MTIFNRSPEPRLIRSLVVAGAAVLAALWQPASAAPANALLFRGHGLSTTAHAQDVPQRIISLVPAVTEMLFAMNAGGQVAAVSSYDTYPPEARSRPQVGALLDPDFERILSLRPDLVIVYETQTELLARLGRAGIPVYRYQHKGLADITSTIRDVGRRVGHTADGERLARAIEDDLAAVRQAVAGRPRPRTVLLFGREPGSLRGLYVSGGVGFMHDMLEAAGGTDAFADVRRESLQVSTETLLARAPEAIVEVHGAAGWDAAMLARERDVWRALPALPAVRTNRVYLFADDRLVIPGPRVAEGVRLIASALHPEAFERQSPPVSQ